MDGWISSYTVRLVSRQVVPWGSKEKTAKQVSRQVVPCGRKRRQLH